MHKSGRIRGIGFRFALALSLGLILCAARGHDHLEDGFALLKKGKYEKAKQHFDKAIEKFKEKGISLGVFMGYEGLGDVARANRKPEEALALYKISLQYSRDASWDARNRISYKSSQIEDEIYQQFVASAPNRGETYDAFLTKYPANRNASNARQQRDGLQYTPYLARNTLKDYAEFIDNFPNNVFLPKALDRVYAIWGTDFGKEGASDAVGDYDQFLRDFPSTRLRAAAMMMRSYYAALLSDSPATFSDFFARQKIVSVPLLGSQEIMDLTDRLERLAERGQTATPFLLLYENTGQRRHLQRAAELVRTAQEESYFVKTNPRTYFGLGEAGHAGQIVSKKEMLDSLVEGAQREGLAGLLVSAYIPKLETTVRPAFDIPIYSRATLGSYKVELEFTMKVRRTWRFTGVLGSLGQLSGQASSGEDYETYTARATATLAPKDRRSVNVKFSEITTSSQQSFVGLAGVEQTRDVIELTPRITSVILTAPSGAQEWKVEVNAQELQTFNDAARQFNTLASMNRSTQIDEWEKTLIAGVAASVSGQEPSTPKSLANSGRSTGAAQPPESPDESESPFVITGAVYCKGWQYDNQQIKVYLHTDLNWSAAGAFQTDDEGNFSFTLPQDFSGAGSKSLKFVGDCGEDFLGTSQPLKRAVVKLR